MDSYKCEFEVRKQGAIGEFYPRHVIAEGKTASDARKAAIDKFHELGFECRSPVRTWLLTRYGVEVPLDKDDKPIPDEPLRFVSGSFGWGRTGRHQFG